jgi:hypothetical protein
MEFSGVRSSVARTGQERVLRPGSAQRLIPGCGQFRGPAGEQLFGFDVKLGDTADFVTRMDDGPEWLPRAQQARILGVHADPAGDARGEQGNAGQPGEQPQHQAGDVEQLNPRLQRDELAVLDGDHGRGGSGETGDLTAERI